MFYQTQYTDPTTGDVLAQSRWYSPQSGTFRSRDTRAGNLDSPVSLNRYSYGANNPIRYSDPSGFCVESISVNADGTIHVVPKRGPECNPLDASGGAGLEGTKVREEYGRDAGAYDYQPTRGEPIPISGATWGTAGCTVGAFWCGLAERAGEAVTVLPATVEAFRADPWEFTKGIATLAAACSNPITCGAYTSNQYANDISTKADEHGWAYAAGAVTFDVLTLAGSVATSTTRSGLRAGLRSAHYCSFSGETGVLMADGTVKPISDIAIGDMVTAFDPETGERGERKVTHLWVHQDTLVDLQIGKVSVTTTEDNQFWNQTDSEWQRADQLDTGDYVLTADGDLLPVDGINPESQYSGTAYNLTVNDIHTYYVQVGHDQILVHNTCPDAVSPYSVPYDPDFPGRADPWVSVDTTAYPNPSSAANAAGYPLDANQFWQQWARQQPMTLSATNQHRIFGLGRSPRVDPTWAQLFPEHRVFDGQTIHHHHVGGGRYAIPVPEGLHNPSGPNTGPFHGRPE